MTGEMDHKEMEKSKVFIAVEITEYILNSVAIATILNRTTGNISLMSFDTGKGTRDNISPFDIFTQIIDGSAEIIIDNISFYLNTGESIIIPALRSNQIKPNGRFKMINTIIKNGYE